MPTTKMVLSRALGLSTVQLILAQPIELRITLDGQSLLLPVAAHAPPLSTAAELCREYQLLPATIETGNDRCETLISGEIHRLQTIQMSTGFRPTPIESPLASYYDRAKELEEHLSMLGQRVSDGHSGLVQGKTEYLSKLAASPSVKRIVEIGMVRF